MIKPYIKNETAVDIICSICDKTRDDCEPADCKWMKKLAEEAVDAVPVVRCRDCTAQQSCNIAQHLGMDGFCSYGERKEGDNGR